MRNVIMMLTFAALSACATVDQEPASAPEPEQASEQSLCTTDAWECWCNTFSTREACNAASTGNGWHCWWAGPTAAERSRGLCHATYE